MISLFGGVMDGGLAEATGPSTCVICQNTLDNQLTLADILALSPIKSPLFCQECLNGLIAIDPKTTCKQCGRDMTIEAAGQVDKEGFCGDCQSWHTYHDWHFTNQAFYQYNGVFKDWLVVLKGQGDIRGRHLFAKELKAVYRKHMEAIWVPMPSSSEKVANRGFNQTRLILEAAVIPFQDLLMSEGSRGKQAYKNRHDRLQDTSKIKVKKDLENIDKNRPIILFDDVYTTGTSMFSAYMALELAGFSQVSGLTLAR